MCRSYLIAVIDDDDPFLDLMHEILSEDGYRVVLGRSGDDALSLIQANNPDLVILDVLLSLCQSGVDVLRALREEPHFAHLPLIVCSADVSFLYAHETELRDMGAKILHKPFDIEALSALVQSLLGIQQKPEAGQAVG
jgi:DNA-binding response OmpR family regulator